MTLPNTFANETSPGMVELDQNFAAVANMAQWNASATGTNTVALTTTANQPAVSAYADRQRFQFVGPNNSTGSVTVAVNGLSALPLYLITGVQAASGDIASGTPYEIIYLSALNSGNGGFQVLSNVPSSAVIPTAIGCARGLLMTNNTSTPSTKIDITAGQTVMVTTGGAPKFVAAVSVTIDLTTTGANGMDTGARPTSGYVYCYIISNGTVTAGLATATAPSAGGPTLPGGYTYQNYVGAMFCDGSQNLFRSRQQRDTVHYVVTPATNTAAFLGLGFTAGTTLNPFTLGSLAPTLVASELGVMGGSSSNGLAVISANNNTSATSFVANPSPLGTGAPAGATGLSGWLGLETTTIYAAIQSGSLGVFITGWRDKYAGV